MSLKCLNHTADYQQPAFGFLSKARPFGRWQQEHVNFEISEFISNLLPLGRGMA